jgi:hypothetical protein
LHDSDPTTLIATQMIQDRDQQADDRINLIIDTFHDQRNAYFFQITPIGTRSEGLIENNSTFRREWNTIWYGEATIDEGGWSAEIAIPFQSVSFAPDKTTWGLEIERQIRRRNEKARWANPSQNRTVLNVAGIGTITGLEDLKGTGVDVKPTFSASYLRDRQEHDYDRKGRPGLDVFYRPSSFVAAGLTLNTDFTDAPVDDRQTNLTRFALFFPETRDFFLQDAGIFEFAGLEQNGRPFFSRRIGLIDNAIANLDAGLKLTGRIGDVNFGALGVRMAQEGAYDATNLAVARVQVNVLEESQLGMIFTSGDPRDEIDNNVIGMDFRYRDSSFRGSNILAADLWFERSQSGETSGQEAAFGARIDYPNDRVKFKGTFTEIQENFNPLLGFTNRRGIRQYDGEFRYRVRPGGYFRTIDTGFTTKLVTNRHNNLETNEIALNLVEFANNPGDTFALSYIFQEERLTANLESFPDTILLPGDYRADRYRIAFETTRARLIKVKLQFTWGEFYDGRLQETLAVLELRPAPQFFGAIEYEQNDGRLPERTVVDNGQSTTYPGDFTNRLVRVRLDFGFTPEIAWTNLIQYDNTTDTIGVNSRFRWEIESGNEFFLVFNQGYEVDRSNIAPTSSQATAKLGWTFRF